jgi:hypothetical protein
MSDADDKLRPPIGKTLRAGSACTRPTKYMAEIVAERVVVHLERAGFVVMKRPPGDRQRGAGAGLRAMTAANGS